MTKVRTDRLWDLSQPICHDGPAWAEYDPPTITRNYRRGAEGFNAETPQYPHRHPRRRSVPLRRRRAVGRADAALGLRGPGGLPRPPRGGRALPGDRPEQLGDKLDLLDEGDFAVLVTGWGKRRASSEEFLKRWPYLGGEGACLLLERGIAGVGIDALSIGGWGGPEKGEPSHLALLGAGKVIVEDVRIPEEPTGRRAFLSAFPILLEGCGDAWTRAVAWELEDG
jgi:kynurenine formamidase